RATGNAADNTLRGADGADTLDGAAGADLLAGGAGDDTYRVDATDTVVEALDGGRDRIVASIDLHAVANVEVLEVVGEGLTATGGDADDELVGSAGHQVLIGAGGNDTLDGSTGGDRMDGGAGNDTYIVDDLGDEVIEAADGGIDTVVTAFEGTVAENIENIRLTGTAHRATGNAADNRLSGNAGDDTLDGAGGDDLLLGGDGSDVLHSHSGADTLSGGAGDDVYKIGHGRSAQIDDLLGHDLIDASDSSSDDLIDLSGSSHSHIDGDDVYVTPGGTTAGPLDVQFLQDLSGSFGDDIANVRTLVPQIVTALRAVQADSRFGVTSFIDKPVTPFGAAGEWVYKLELGLTANQALLSSTYNALQIRFGNDEPESQIEGLMQLALHANETGFRADSARFVVLFTDANYHVAGDGRLGGILTPNNGDAVIVGNGAGEDYPLIPQVRSALEAANIIPVFAIANGLTGTYEALAGQLGRGVVVPLTADSSNVVAAITSGLTEATTTYIEDAYGGHGHDHLIGNVKGNQLRGNGGNDTIDGAAGNDTVTGGAGDDDLTGGSGADVAVYTGGVGDYAVSVSAGVYTIDDRRGTGSDGRDTLREIETVQLADGSYSLVQLADTAPVGVADRASGVVEAGGVANGTPGQPLGSGNVLANDTDVNLAIAALGEQLHVAAAGAGAVAAADALAAVTGSMVLSGTFGDLTLGADGTWQYALVDTRAATQSLAAGQLGQDLFTYAVADRAGNQSRATLTVDVTGANDAPTATDVTLAPMVVGTPARLITAAELLAGAADVDSATLTVTGVTAASGSVVANADGTWTWSPAPGATPGPVALDFSVSDGAASAAAQAHVELLPGSVTAPDTADAGAAGTEDGGAIAVVLQGSDADGSVAQFRITSLPAGATLYADAALTRALAVGDTVAASAGAATVQLVPAADVNGALGFGFAAVDDIGLQDLTPAAATVAVAAVNDAPRGVADTLSATEDTAASFTAAQLLANDVDVDGDAIVVQSVSAGSGGSVVLNADGSIAFTPAADFNGAASFSYVAADASLGSAPVTVTVHVAPVNDAPVAMADTLAASEDQAVTYTAAQLLGNDTDVDGDTLHIVSVSAGANGSVVLNADGSVSFTPAANFSGSAGFSYVAGDAASSSAATDVVVQVAAVNDAPVAVADSVAATEDTVLVIPAAQLLGNDSDVESDALSIGAVTAIAGGSVALNADGSVSFTPAADFNGTARFSYRASDGSAASADVAVSVNVAAVNDAPVAADDSGYLVNSGALLDGIAVLANDSDVDGDALHVQGTPTALHGTVGVNADGTLAYRSEAGFIGTDTIDYTVSDGSASDTAQVTVVVKTPNDPPVVAGEAALSGNEDEVRIVTLAELLSQASDPNGDTLSVTGLTASSGTLADLGDGRWSLTPLANDDTEVLFSYRVDDGRESAAATARLDLLPVNDAAVISGIASGAVAESGTGSVSAPATGVLSATDIDTATTFSVATDGQYGSLSISAAGAWSYLLNNAAPAVEALNTGSPALVDHVTVQTADGTTQVIEISIAGANDVRTGTAGDDVLNGGDGLDTLIGLAGRDTLNAGGGNDVLDGGADGDAMSGGAGDDLYLVDNARDTVTEGVDGGNDVVQSSVTFVLGANVEQLVLTGTAAANGTGNAGANTITGNAGNNLLVGLGGADLIDGGAGVDGTSYLASTAGVNVGLSGGVGSGGDAAGDVLLNLENLTGSGQNDTLEGSSGNNVLDGDRGTDLASFEHAGGAVTVSLVPTGAQNTLGAGTDTLLNFEGLIGSGFGDTLTGNSAHNVLQGLGGNDVLTGGAGADTLTGGAGADRFVFAVLGDVSTANARDTITDFSHADGDIIHLLGIDADSKTGGDQAFSFIGTGAFGNRAGELRYVLSAGGATLQADLNGDGKADFSIELTGVTALVATDFVL
ncbi:MAG: cadherin-like domain-containing protein, partial [Rubrivivax sp.]